MAKARRPIRSDKPCAPRACSPPRRSGHRALFRQYDFFDSPDLLQVKYEMLRRVEAEAHSVTATAAAFGLSRPSFYEARTAWQREGLAGLLPKKRGPRRGHKLTPEVVAFLERRRAEDALSVLPRWCAR